MEIATCTPVLSKRKPSGAYVVPLTWYSAATGPRSTEWSTHIWAFKNHIVNLSEVQWGEYCAPKQWFKIQCIGKKKNEWKIKILKQVNWIIHNYNNDDISCSKARIF